MRTFDCYERRIKTIYLIKLSNKIIIKKLRGIKYNLRARAHVSFMYANPRVISFILDEK